jgi:hypothetical protein
MKKKPLKTHFFLLLAGSIIFLMHFFASYESSGKGDRTLLEVWRIKNLLLGTAFYIVFATLVIGHGISDLGRESITDAESNMEVLDGVDAAGDP